MENVKRIPYGVSDFVDIIKRNQYYVDKTMYIPKLEEEADSLFFIRPRRFGKSLLLSMMCAYYDINQSDRFEPSPAALLRRSLRYWLTAQSAAENSAPAHRVPHP